MPLRGTRTSPHPAPILVAASSSKCAQAWQLGMKMGDVFTNEPSLLIWGELSSGSWQVGTTNLELRET